MEESSIDDSTSGSEKHQNNVAMVRKVVGAMQDYNSDKDTETFVKWWKNNSNLIP